MTFMGINHESSFPKCPGLFKLFVQLEHYFFEKDPHEPILSHFSYQSFTKRKS